MASDVTKDTLTTFTNQSNSELHVEQAAGILLASLAHSFTVRACVTRQKSHEANIVHGHADNKDFCPYESLKVILQIE